MAKARRAQGEGSLTRRKDGRWQAALCVNGRRITVYGISKSDARMKLDALKSHAKASGSLPTQAKLTLSEYLHQWLESQKHNLRPATFSNYNTMLRLHVLPRLGHMKLSKITSFGLSIHFTKLTQTCGAATLSKAYMVLNKALNDAVKLGLLSVNPLSQVEPPRHEPKEKALWTAEQARTFLAAVDSDGMTYGSLWSFLLASGCRLGEALALRPSDVDFRKQTVTISKSIAYVNGELIEGLPKTKAGRRTLSLPSWCMNALQEQVAKTVLTGGGRLFTTSSGSVPWRRNLLREFHAACRRARVPQITIHCLRHIHCSLLALSGVPIKVTQERLGHSKAAVTMDIYSHVLGNGDRSAADALEDW